MGIVIEIYYDCGGVFRKYQIFVRSQIYIYKENLEYINAMQRRTNRLRIEVKNDSLNEKKGKASSLFITTKKKCYMLFCLVQTKYDG